MLIRIFFVSIITPSLHGHLGGILSLYASKVLVKNVWARKVFRDE